MVQLTLSDNFVDAVLWAEPEYATVIQMSWIILFKQFRFNTESINDFLKLFGARFGKNKLHELRGVQLKKKKFRQICPFFRKIWLLEQEN